MKVNLSSICNRYRCRDFEFTEFRRMFEISINYMVHMFFYVGKFYNNNLITIVYDNR